MGINRSRRIILPNPPQASPQSDELIAAPAQRCFQSQRRPEASTVGPVGILRVTCQLRGIAVISRQALMCHKARNDAYGERASAESESEDAVACFWRRALSVIATQEAVKINDVALEAEAENAAKDGKGFERRGTDPVVIIRHLPIRIAQIEGLVEPPNICREQRRRRVPCPVGQKNDVLGHGFPLLAVLQADRSLALCQDEIVGYSLLSFTRASSVVNCQCALALLAFRLMFHAWTLLRSVSFSSIRLFLLPGFTCIF